MKLLYEFEDAIVGVICGLLVIGLTGRFFSLKLSNVIYTIVFIVFILFILLDLVNEFRDLATRFWLTMVSIAHNIIDLIIALGFISYFAKLNIPYITSAIVPYLQNETSLFYVGIFLVLGNAIWLAIYPFL